ncbi:MAG: YmdB family metallophosphoesterase, partial [Pseudomonadota bacterium]|nr:YmdB family metallophosphoesterase [Pseudomonadota bacterium]
DLGQLRAGRERFVVGTHTHLTSLDYSVLAHCKAYQTVAGMCGDYDSVIGMKKDAPIDRFTRKMPSARLEPADGDATLCGVFVETDDASGLARRIAPVRLGGQLSPAWPE